MSYNLSIEQFDLGILEQMSLKDQVNVIRNYVDTDKEAKAFLKKNKVKNVD